MGRHRNYGGAGPVVPFPEDDMQERKFSIPLAQFLDLSANPFEILPAPGAGKVHLIWGLWTLTHNAAVGFAAGSDLQVGYGDPAAGDGIFAGPAACFTATLNNAAWNIGGSFGQICDAPANVVNTAIRLGVIGIDFTGGDAPVTGSLFYTTINSG